MRKLFITLLVVVAGAMISQTVFAKDIVVEIYKKKFTPSEITIEQGDTVIWKNIEKRQYHNVWFKQFDKDEPDYLFPDDTYQRTFNDKGQFPYECGPHPQMTGIITVVPSK